jgi:hypothetical protein
MSKKIDVNRIQLLMQLHDKGMVSAQTVLDEFGLEWNNEFDALRKENESLHAEWTPGSKAQKMTKRGSGLRPILH